MYYDDKLPALRDIFGTSDVSVENRSIRVGALRYPVIDDVVVILDPTQYTERLRSLLGEAPRPENGALVGGQFAGDIQKSFGAEWTEYGVVLAEHEKLFEQYFDRVDLSALKDKRVCDLGCGNGRWSYFMSRHCRELVLVDFSDAIFTARRNLAAATNCLFFMGNVKRLPFKADFADLLFSLGVLHHLPTPCLDEVRTLSRYAPKLLVYLYYALDNRPRHFRLLLAAVGLIRKAASNIHSKGFRRVFSKAVAALVYRPLVLLGRALRPFGLSEHVPLYPFYHDKSFSQIEQDVYDRFFTGIEQRVSRADILALRDTFSKITISDRMPYWHFVCDR